MMRHPVRLVLWTAAFAAFGCASVTSLEQVADLGIGDRRDLSVGYDGDLSVPVRADLSVPVPADMSHAPKDLATPVQMYDLGPCGRSGMRRGLTNRSIMAGGANRTYLVYLPMNLSPTQPLPLVFVHHGFTMSGQKMHDVTLYSNLADQEGIAVVFPDGEGGPNLPLAPWNVGTGVCGLGAIENATGDDFSFVEAMRADVEVDQCVDSNHVFMTGFSMGGYFSHHVGCMRPDLARAIAPHSGGTHDFSGCAPGHRPVIMFHGTSDGVIDPNCEKMARDQWVKKNQCSSTVRTVAVLGGHCEYSDGCPADGQVALCLFDNMAHKWAGGAAGQADSDPNYDSATRLEWNFFKQYAW